MTCENQVNSNHHRCHQSSVSTQRTRLKPYLGICIGDFSGPVWTLSRACYDCHHFTPAVLGYLHLMAFGVLLQDLFDLKN